MTINVRFWLGVMFIFGILFRPPILPIDIIFPLTAISIYGIFREVAFKKFDTRHFFLSRPVRSLAKWSALMVILSAISIMVGFATMSDYSMLSAISTSAKLMWTFWLFPINIAFFLMICQKYNVQVNTILRMILYATMLQAVLAILAYAIPEVKNIFISIMQANNWSERWTTNNAAGQRMNGFAKSLFDTFGYGMGILASVPFILAYRTSNLKYLLALPFILLAILINARTGLVIFGVVAALFLLLFLRHNRQFSRYRSNILVLVVLLLAIVPIGISSVTSYVSSGSNFSDRTMDDIDSYIEFIQTGGAYTGSYGGQADILFSDSFWTLPTNKLQLFVGTGVSVYGSSSPFEFSSDVGYVNAVWYMGLIGLIIFHVTFLWYLWISSRHKKYWRTFAAAAIVSVLVFQVKGSAFWSANLGISATILLLALCIYQQRHDKRDYVINQEGTVRT